MVKIMNRSGELLAEFDVENIRDADLSDADLSDADLSDAGLGGADLSGADLSGADLSGANLSGADLSDAGLSYTNMRGADLSYTNLSDADLSGADMRGADLRGADMSDADLIIITWMHRTVYITTGHIRIGCQAHSLNDWKNFTDDQISEMDSNALNFWKENKELIIGLCERLEEKK